ncbi:MAG: YraN family protein [Candidatus Amulumruptor caecigallinarius]|nr:YraN family protein [Candidatus Amulumruptor caecigallinarius]MCM1397502.1 YraN family protein [Candidatus Amulumruptor caecigallinarius]MCM1454404.1 YraN family protein [bacterium]
MADHNDIGRWGEEAARDYLVSRGYAIVGTNVRWGNVEIDIIAMEGTFIVFAEVKTRADRKLDPALAVDERKLRRLCRAADSYVSHYDLHADPRIDLLCVTGTPEEGIRRLDHYPDIYLPGGHLTIPAIPDTD